MGRRAAQPQARRAVLPRARRPILELHRENLRLAAHEHPHRRSSGSRSFSSRRSCRGCSGKGMFKDKAPLDVKELYIAYLDIILPEK